MSLSVRKLTGRIGGIVEGVDLSADPGTSAHPTVPAVPGTTNVLSETLIANTAAAYRDLPDSLRDLADSLVAA